MAELGAGLHFEFLVWFKGEFVAHVNEDLAKVLLYAHHLRLGLCTPKEESNWRWRQDNNEK